MSNDNCINRRSPTFAPFVLPMLQRMAFLWESEKRQSQFIRFSYVLQLGCLPSVPLHMRAFSLCTNHERSRLCAVHVALDCLLYSANLI